MRNRVLLFRRKFFMSYDTVPELADETPTMTCPLATGHCFVDVDHVRVIGTSVGLQAVVEAQAKRARVNIFETRWFRVGVCCRPSDVTFVPVLPGQTN